MKVKAYTIQRKFKAEISIRRLMLKLLKVEMCLANWKLNNVKTVEGLKSFKRFEGWNNVKNISGWNSDKKIEG